MDKPDKLKVLFENNKRWVQDLRQKEPAFFKSIAHIQSPKYLWIGCSDSRVPANQITGLLPGELFVHRNVANIVVHSDLNCLSVLQYAVEALRVSDIIVCGHFGCGGVEAVFQSKRFGLVDNWLRHVLDVQNKYAHQLQSIEDEEKRFRQLCELNALEQANNVCQTTVIQDAWKKGQAISVHAVIYDVCDGLLRHLWTKKSDGKK